MSYDLYLYPRQGKKLMKRERFFEHFQGELWEQQGNEVHYSNPDTGVYFHLAYSEGGAAGGDDPNAGTSPHVYFNMNYFRPHTFALEAERELTPFVEEFKLTVDDPQAEGMGRGEYTAEGFLRGWNAGNRFAAQAFREMGTAIGGSLSLPTEVNRRLWGWNYNREDIVEELQEIEFIDVYVPPIWYCNEGGRAKTFCLFPNLVPTGVPRTDYVLITRDELAAKYKKKSKETPAWVKWDELVAVAKGFEVRREDAGVTDLEYLLLFDDEYQSMETPPEALARWVIGLPDWPGKPETVSPDQVLDAELLAGGGGR